MFSCKKDNDSSNSNTVIENPLVCNATNVFNSSLTYGTLKDINGNAYKTIQIGGKNWMAENLKATKYKNGNPITNITDKTQWASTTTGAYCSYNNDPINDCPYGKLYNWYAVANSNGLCPTGWHVSTDAEWTDLVNDIGGSTNSGNKMKSEGTQYWLSPNQGATNSSGFSGLPGNSRTLNGDFSSSSVRGSFGTWWSSTETETGAEAWDRVLRYDNSNLLRLSGNKAAGFTVRCVED
jgi:uncharacterized protein (TIGR02145 family)